MTFQDDRNRAKRASESDNDELSHAKYLLSGAEIILDSHYKIDGLEELLADHPESTEKALAWLHTNGFIAADRSLVQQPLDSLIEITRILKTDEEALARMALPEISVGFHVYLCALNGEEDIEHDFALHWYCQQHYLQCMLLLKLINGDQLEAAKDLLKPGVLGSDIQLRSIWKFLLDQGIVGNDEACQALDRAITHALSVGRYVVNGATRRYLSQDLLELLRTLDPDYVGKQIDALNAKKKRATYLKWGGAALLLVVALLAFW